LDSVLDVADRPGALPSAALHLSTHREMNKMNRVLALAVMLLAVALASPSDADGPLSLVTQVSAGAEAHAVPLAGPFARVASDRGLTVVVNVASRSLELHRVETAETLGMKVRDDFIDVAAGVLGLQVHRFPGLSFP
jgi:hypothetical protein